MIYFKDKQANFESSLSYNCSTPSKRVLYQNSELTHDFIKIKKIEKISLHVILKNLFKFILCNFRYKLVLK